MSQEKSSLLSRFFAFISLFAFGMFTLVVSDNLLTMFAGWEIMGLCSYLLIGFWYAKESARNAAIKAFMTTRVGDVFMLLGIAFLPYTTIMYMLVWSPTGINGWDWMWIILGFFLDVTHWAQSYQRRKEVPLYPDNL